MKHITFTLVLFMCYIVADAQDIPLTDSLKRQLKNAASDEQKGFWLGQLTRWYNALDPHQAAGYARQQLQLAESSVNSNLRLQAFNDNAAYYLMKSETSDDSARYFANKAIDLGKQEKNNEYKAWGTLMLAYIANYKGQYEDAMRYTTEANTIATTVASDSLHWSCSTMFANVYDAKKERLSAFRHYMNALNLAEQVKHEQLLFYSFTFITQFYYSIGNYNKAKEYAHKALDISFKINKPYERMFLYDQMGLIYTDDKVYDVATVYFDKGLKVGDTLKVPVSFKMDIYNHIMRQYFLMGDYAKVSRFFNEHEDLQQSYHQWGAGYFSDMLRARLFVYTGKIDSASAYFKKAEPLVDSMGQPFQKHLFYDWYGDYFRKKGDVKNAIAYFKKDEAITAQSNLMEDLIKATANLDSMYVLQGDYKAAYGYNNLYNKYRDSLQKLTNEKELLSAEIDQETLRLERVAKQEELDKQRRHNVQYMGIAAALAALIILLIMIGLFSVSVTSIKALGFFTFIFLFEFIIVIADEKIHHLTHGEPWQVVLIKIILACMLVPLHHYTEHKVIHYLSKHKLLSLKKPKLFTGFFKKNPNQVIVESKVGSEEGAGD